MDSMLWSALTLGFIGSLHCVCMCGPIAVALPKNAGGKGRFLAGRMIYNSGRVLTYMILGAICGLFGGLIAMAGFQQTVSIVAGAIILVAVFFPKLSQFMNANTAALRFINRMGALWKQLFTSPKLFALFGIGLLNGFLPCGLLYVALIAAATTAGAVEGASYMLLFGLGTFPAMLAISLMGGLLPMWARRFATRAIPTGAVILAVLLILRGMSLGIPYISPNLSSDKPAAADHSNLHDCCK